MRKKGLSPDRGGADGLRKTLRTIFHLVSASESPPTLCAETGWRPEQLADAHIEKGKKGRSDAHAASLYVRINGQDGCSRSGHSPSQRRFSRIGRVNINNYKT